MFLQAPVAVAKKKRGPHRGVVLCWVCVDEACVQKEHRTNGFRALVKTDSRDTSFPSPTYGFINPRAALLALLKCEPTTIDLARPQP